VRVPSDSRSKYGLPGEIVHRIVRVNHGPQGLFFVTKGDANAGNDVFTTPASDVVGREVTAVAGLGYPFLFFRSTQGRIFILAAIAVGILYFILGVFEERRAFTEGTAVAFETILAETNALKATIDAAGASTARPPPWPVHDSEIRQAVQSSERVETTMRELVAAIGEYGTHLRSHTAVMQNLAATTGELQQATVEMRSAITGGPAPPLPAPEAQPLAAVSSDTLANSPETPRPQLSQLKRTLRGYSRESVDALLDQVTQRLDETDRNVAQLAQENAKLRGERDELEGELTRYRQLETSLSETLALAQLTAAQLRERAEQEAERLIEAAQRQAADHVRRAELERARLTAETETIRGQLRQALGTLPLPPVSPTDES
jgi:DivIVA domain-containing protein